MNERTDLLQGIDTIILRVGDINASKAWYHKNMDFATTWEDNSMKLAVLNTNGTTSLTLWETQEPISTNRETASYPIFRTPDAVALHSLLLSRGVRVGELNRAEGITYFSFTDPDGNILEACQVNA